MDPLLIELITALEFRRPDCSNPQPQPNGQHHVFTRTLAEYLQTVHATSTTATKSAAPKSATAAKSSKPTVSESDVLRMTKIISSIDEMTNANPESIRTIFVQLASKIDYERFASLAYLLAIRVKFYGDVLEIRRSDFNGSWSPTHIAYLRCVIAIKVNDSWEIVSCSGATMPRYTSHQQLPLLAGVTYYLCRKHDGQNIVCFVVPFRIAGLVCVQYKGCWIGIRSNKSSGLAEDLAVHVRSLLIDIEDKSHELSQYFDWIIAGPNRSMWFELIRKETVYGILTNYGETRLVPTHRVASGIYVPAATDIVIESRGQLGELIRNPITSEGFILKDQTGNGVKIINLRYLLYKELLEMIRREARGLPTAKNPTAFIAQHGLNHDECIALRFGHNEC